MKKFLFCCMAFFCFALMLACNSTPQDAGSGAAAQVSDESYQAVYSRYASGLILDGAGKYTVVYRDTLAGISRSKYRNGFYFPIIMLASRDIVLDPDKIVPGMVLTIPNLEANLNNPDARNTIKGFLLEIADLEVQRNRPRNSEGLRNLSASL